MISDGLSGGIIFMVGLILMSWPLIILILAEATILSPLGIVLAFATGLGFGMSLSQVWNPDWEVRTFINMIVQTTIEGIIGGGIVLGLTLSGPALLALTLLWLFSQFGLDYNLGNMFPPIFGYRKREVKISV